MNIKKRVCIVLLTTIGVAFLNTTPIIAQTFELNVVDTIQGYQTGTIRGYDIACADSEHCAYVGKIDSFSVIASFIRSTTDGGTTWRTVWTDSFTVTNQRLLMPNRIAHPTPSLIIMVADGGYVFRSTNGGESWREERLFTESISLRSLEMFDGEKGVVIAGSSRIFQTIDSGSSWQPVALPDSLLSYSYDYAIPLTPRKLLIRIAKPGDVRVVLTENEGDNWRVVTGPWAAARMSFVDSLYGWAVGNELDSGSLFVGKDVIVQTTDGGLTWHDQVREYVEPKLGLSDVDCADRLNCIAGGGANKLVVTTDGGKTWNGIDAFSGSSVSIRGVAYPSLETAFVIGGDASILRLKRQSLTVRLEDTHQSTESVVVRERSLVIPASIHQGEPFELLTYNLLGKQCSVEQVKPHQGGVPLLLSLELLPGVYAVAIKRKEGQITTTKVILSGR